MAAKKSSKTRKVTRAKASKKSSVRTGRKAPGVPTMPGPQDLPKLQVYV